MRIVVLGGTRFIGRAVVEELSAREHEVVVVHRGRTEPQDLVEVEHMHVDRAELRDHAADLAALRPDAVVDTRALTRADAEAAVAALPDVPLVALSSVDVYLAFGELMVGKGGQPVPIDEQSPVRRDRYPYRGRGPDYDDYEKLDVEEVYGRRQAAIFRLPVVFGPHDGQRREEFMLKRVRHARERIPFGAGTWLCSRVHAADVASAVRLALEAPGTSGIFNLAPAKTLTIRQWADAILTAAGHTAELVRVPDAALPEDLGLTADQPQHLLLSADRAIRALGWRPGDLGERIADSVAWHMKHPPKGIEHALTDDDQALGAA